MNDFLLPGQVALSLTWADTATFLKNLHNAITPGEMRTVLIAGNQSQHCHDLQRLWESIAGHCETNSFASLVLEHLPGDFQVGASLLLLSSSLNVWVWVDPILKGDAVPTAAVSDAASLWRITLTFDRHAILTFLRHPLVKGAVPDFACLTEADLSNSEHLLQALWLKLLPFLLNSSSPAASVPSQVAPAPLAVSDTYYPFWAFLEQSTDVFAEYDRTLQYRFINAAGCSLLNRHASEIIGQTDRDLLGTIAEEWEQKLRRTFDTGKPVRLEHEICLAEDCRVFEVVFMPISDATGAVQRVISMNRDITEHKQRWQFLETQNQHLNETAHLKQEFIATTSHELRAPLTSILGFSNVLLQEFFGELNLKQRDYLDRIHHSGLHLLELINDILDLSRMEGDRLELAPQPISIVDMCESVISLVQESAINQGLTIDVNLADDLELIVADPRRLKQMLLNLLTNAIKFTPTGTVGLKVYRQERARSTLQCTPRPTPNHAQPDRSGEMIHFLVWDTGIGIDEIDQQRLFRPFSQIETPFSRQRQPQGSGLGLVITRKLAELHGGSIELQSRLGEGAKFTLSLPQNLPLKLYSTSMTELIQQETSLLTVTDV